MNTEDLTTDPTPEAADAAPRGRARRRPRSGPEARERQRRLVRYALLAVSGVLMVNALFGEKGYLATIQARQESDRVERQLAALRADNEQLAELIRRMREDPNALEDAARRDLGLIRPGETLITLRDRPKN